MAKKPTGKKREYREFILGMRDQINRRVNSAIGRFPNYRLDAIRAGFEQCFRNLYEANAQNPQPNFGEIFDSLLNLFLLAVGQNYYTGTEMPIRHPYLDPLFNTIFPQCLPLLSASPDGVPAMLFNACEYVEERAGKFLNALTRVLPSLDIKTFEQIIQILIWWLGDPRRRQIALTTLIGLPEGTRTEVFNQLFEASYDAGHVLDVIEAMMNNPWIHPEEYLKLSENKFSTQIKTKELLNNLNDKCRLKYGSFTGFNGIYDAPPKIAGFQKGYVVTYTPTGKLFYSMLDGIGSWEIRIPITPCTKLIHPTEDSCFGITTTGKLLNLRSGDQIDLDYVLECIDLFADAHFLFVLAKTNKTFNSILKFHVDWAKNPTRTTRKVKKNVTDPITVITLPAQPYHLSPDPDRPDTLFLEFYKKEGMKYQLVCVTVNATSEIVNSSVLFEEKEPFLFTIKEKACHIIHANGSYDRYNLECTKADLTLQFHRLTHPTSLFINGSDIFATSTHSFHLFGFLPRPPESGVPAEIDLISRR